jgi:hypothetical protein
MGEEKPEEELMGKISSLRGSIQHHKDVVPFIMEIVEVFIHS